MEKLWAAGLQDGRYTLLQINMEAEKGDYYPHIRPPMSCHVDLVEVYMFRNLGAQLMGRRLTNPAAAA